MAMARGISEHFLRIARNEERAGRTAALAAAALAPLAGFLAELADPPGYGPIWTLFLVALLAGLAGGALLARRRLGRIEDGLRLRWTHWMHGATRAARLEDVERQVEGRGPRIETLPALAAAGLLAANLLLFALLWGEHALAEPLAWVVIGTDGLVLGGLVASSALVIRWSRSFVQSAEDLVRRGEVGLWGER